MRKIVNFAVSYPVSITMLILAILLLGKISYDRLGVDLLPSIESSKLYIELTTTENPPVEVEQQFVESIEATAIRTDNAKSVKSQIRESGALITVEYQWGTDMDDAFLDLQMAVTSYSQNSDIEEISVSQLDPSGDPVMLLSLSHSEMEPVDLTRIANNYLRPQLLSVDGVADVDFTGDIVNEVVIDTDPYTLEAYGLDVSTLAQTIESNNYTLSGGQIEDMGVRYIVSGSNLIESIEEFSTIIVGYKDRNTSEISETGTSSATSLKGAIYLGDVAKIYVATEEQTSIVRLNGDEGVGIEVYKERDFNTLKATNNVLAKLETMRKAMPGYTIEVVTNQGGFIEDSIGAVQDSALIGMALAVLILFIFLRRIGTTIVVSLAIPISIIATFSMFYFGGLTLNIMTLGGLALGAGMLVDNAIVVIESIFKKQESGIEVKEAIIEGTSEVGSAIIASTITTIVVFLPIVYLQGETGALFKDQAWSVTFALISSLFVAILAIPMLYNRFLGGKKSSKKTTQSNNSVKITGYGKFLRGVLRRRYAVVLATIIFVGSVFMLSAQIGSEFIPSSDSGSLKIDIELPEGTTLASSHSTIRGIESLIDQIVRDSSTTTYSHIGVAGSDGGTTPLSNHASIIVNLGDGALIGVSELTEEVEDYLATINEIKVTFSDAQGGVTSLLQDDGSDIIVEIKGEELDELMDINDLVVNELSTLSNIGSLSYQERDGSSEVTVTVDRVTPSVYGLSLNTIISEVSSLLSGTEAGTMDLNGDITNIRVQLPKVNISDLSSIAVSSGEQRILLGEVADIKIEPAASQILRSDQSRIMQVAIRAKDDAPLSQVADSVRAALAKIDIPSDYYVSIEGSEQQREESMNSLIFALALSIILVYMVMASQFESLLHPFTILLTIPLAVAGALLLFLITGKSLNIMAAIGIVMLVGIAVNSSILLVDRIGQLIKSGEKLTDAIILAAEQRIRPIIMTSTTTILALLPMSLSFGDGSEFQNSMAIAVIGGLVASTALSLIVIPCVYYILESIKRSLFKAKLTE